MRLTIANLSPQAFLLQGELAKHGQIFNFSFGQSRLSPRHLLDSTFSTPGRYSAELLMRAQREAPDSPAWLVVNPRFAPNSDSLLALVDVALSAEPERDFTVFADAFGRTAGVLFRRRLERKELLTLSAQSAWDPQLDHALLETAFGFIGNVRPAAHADMGSPFANGFLEGSFDEEAVRLPARLALQALRQGPHAVLKQIVVMPYHAGDVLFLAQAIQAHPHIDAVVTGPGFADILHESVPWVRTLAFDSALNGRDGFWSHNEQIHLTQLVRTAQAVATREGSPLTGVFHLFRPHRNHAHSHFHLNQQVLFAIGASCEESAEVWPLARTQRRQPHRTENQRRRVILHFDGGWGLKGYPPPLRPQLIGLLRSAGFSPWVLGSKEGGLDVDHEPFIGLPRLRALLADSAAVVGIDSFPAHYAVHWGIPTIHLFASTHPRNASYPETSASSALHRDMPCVPCGATVECKLDGASTCRAAPTPHMVLERLLGLAGAPTRDLEIPLNADLLSMGDAERYAREYADALPLALEVKAAKPHGRVLVVDCGQGALVRRLAEQGFRTSGVSYDADPSWPRRLSGIEIHTQLPSHERFDVVIAQGARAPLLAELEPLLSKGGLLWDRRAPPRPTDLPLDLDLKLSPLPEQRS